MATGASDEGEQLLHYCSGADYGSSPGCTLLCYLLLWPGEAMCEAKSFLRHKPIFVLLVPSLLPILYLKGECGFRSKRVGNACPLDAAAGGGSTCGVTSCTAGFLAAAY